MLHMVSSSRPIPLGGSYLVQKFDKFPGVIAMGSAGSKQKKKDDIYVQHRKLDPRYYKKPEHQCCVPNTKIQITSMDFFEPTKSRRKSVPDVEKPKPQQVSFMVGSPEEREYVRHIVEKIARSQVYKDKDDDSKHDTDDEDENNNEDEDEVTDTEADEETDQIQDISSEDSSPEETVDHEPPQENLTNMKQVNSQYPRGPHDGGGDADGEDDSDSGSGSDEDDSDDDGDDEDDDSDDSDDSEDDSDDSDDEEETDSDDESELETDSEEEEDESKDTAKKASKGSGKETTDDSGTSDTSEDETPACPPPAPATCIPPPFWECTPCPVPVPMANYSYCPPFCVNNDDCAFTQTFYFPPDDPPPAPGAPNSESVDPTAQNEHPTSSHRVEQN